MYDDDASSLLSDDVQDGLSYDMDVDHDAWPPALPLPSNGAVGAASDSLGDVLVEHVHRP